MGLGWVSPGGVSVEYVLRATCNVKLAFVCSVDQNECDKNNTEKNTKNKSWSRILALYNKNTRFLTMDVYEASVTVTLTKKPSRLWRLTWRTEQFKIHILNRSVCWLIGLPESDPDSGCPLEKDRKHWLKVHFLLPGNICIKRKGCSQGETFTS